MALWARSRVIAAMVGGVSLAHDERLLISDEFARSGPDRPTLCEGWRTRDLLAHLLVRERQPLAATGIVLPVMSPVHERAIAAYADTPWDAMIADLRGGPPVWSPYRVERFDELANAAEFFVHHEDVRRGEPGWEPRPPEPVRDAALWQLITRMGKLVLRRSPVGVIVRRPDGAVHVVKTGPGIVTLVGEPGELLLHAFGRDAARVEIEGSEADVAAYRSVSRGV